MKSIELTQGLVTLVDDEDYDFLSQFKWYADTYRRGQYAKRNIWNSETKKSKTQLMHRIIMAPNSTEQVDHIDGNGLNNQKSNLRLCSNSQNLRNRKEQKNNTTGYKGVSTHGKKYRATIFVNSKQIYLGSFLTKEEAALEYNKAAIKYFGEFAGINTNILNKKEEE